MPTQTVNLSEHHAAYIQRCIQSGRYQNAAEVVCAGLRFLEQHEADDQLRLQALKRITHEAFAALDRGEYSTFTPETLDGFFGR